MGFNRNNIIDKFENAGEGNEFVKLWFLIMFLVCDIVPILIVLDSSVLNAFMIQAKKPEEYSLLEIDQMSFTELESFKLKQLNMKPFKFDDNEENKTKKSPIYKLSMFW